MQWNLHQAAARRGIDHPSQLHHLCTERGATLSLSTITELWSGHPDTVILAELDTLCIVLDCTVSELLAPETSPPPIR